MISTTSHEAAATAAKQILGFYPEIPASDPKGFAAGLVQTLSIYPREVVERATDPVNGIPSVCSRLNLADIRKHLEKWAVEHHEHIQRVERAARKRIEAPPVDHEMRERVGAGLRELADQLKRGIGPSTVGN